ncbi:MAG: CoA transferase subunit A [Bacteroidales bacterium]|nr:CoA transferase subunit A [Bacteroidales bacterium]MDD4670910.1 CoA transferase subunit A [Bacteroidales bacterium]
MKKNISLHDAVSMVKDGATIMIGGFLGTGSPYQLVDALAESGVKDLTIISNDTVFDGKGWGKLIDNKQVRKVIASYIGSNSASIEQMNSGEMEIELAPQGTLAERIRAKGAGLGGVLTPTGLNTVIEKGKQVINVDGKDYLLEKPLGADFAFIGGSIVDESGNIFYRGTTRNFNPTMAQAADVVIVEAEKVVPVGELAPEAIHTPALFVDYIYVKK